MMCPSAVPVFEEDQRETWAHAPVWFQPIVDTFDHTILAQECLLPPPGGSVEGARLRALGIHAAASKQPRSLYFLNLTAALIDDPELDLQPALDAVTAAGMRPGNLVFEIPEPDLTRDPAHSHHIRDHLAASGFGFALSRAGLGAGVLSFQAICDFRPDYIALDPRLIRDIDHQSSAPTIGKVVELADRSGARVMAKGVDRVRTVENLWLLGVRFMQGQLFGNAVPFS